MNKKRNLLKDLNRTGIEDNGQGPLVIDTEKIKGMVHNSMASAYAERKIRVMKNKKKFAVLAVAVVLVLGISTFAASNIITSWYSSSSSVPEYESLPTAEQCIEDIGYEPVLIETFGNGYTFDSGSVVSNDLTDENNHSVEKFKSVTFRYVKDGDVVNFSQEKFNSGIKTIGEIVATAEGVDIYYHSYTNKLVPADYELTEEDKKAKESGELVFSFGTEDIEVVEVQSVIWSENGVHYVLLQMDGKLSAGELAEMAMEAIQK